MKVWATSCTVPNTKLGALELVSPRGFQTFCAKWTKDKPNFTAHLYHVYISMSSEIISGLFNVMSDEGTFEHDPFTLQ